MKYVKSFGSRRPISPHRFNIFNDLGHFCVENISHVPSFVKIGSRNPENLKCFGKKKNQPESKRERERERQRKIFLKGTEERREGTDIERERRKKTNEVRKLKREREGD